MTDDARQPDRPRLIVGLDLGGTSIKAGLYDGGLHRLATAQPMTPRAGGPEAVIDTMVEATDKLLHDAGLAHESLAAVGVGVPGPVHPATRVVYSLTNLAGWRDVPLSTILGERLECGVVEVANDADAAAFGEYEHLTEHDPSIVDVAVLTLGTGLGGGLITGGRPLTGAHGLGNEVGHVIIEPHGHPCPCGQTGCIEQYASATALITDVRRRLKAGEASELADAAASDALDAKAIAQAAGRGDALAVAAIEQLTDYLAIGIVSVCRLVDPEAVLIGGGLGEAGDVLLDPLRAALDRRWWRISSIQPRVRACELGNEAGRRGAAGLARRRLIKAARR